MLSQDLRNQLIHSMRTNPKDAIKEIEKDPRILEILLNNIETEKNEKIKYINMTSQMQLQLEQKAKQLKITQGLLIGAGILLILSLLDNK